MYKQVLPPLGMTSNYVVVSNLKNTGEDSRLSSYKRCRQSVADGRWSNIFEIVGVVLLEAPARVEDPYRSTESVGRRGKEHHGLEFLGQG